MGTEAGEAGFGERHLAQEGQFIEVPRKLGDPKAQEPQNP